MSEKWEVVFKELNKKDFCSAENFVAALKEHGFSDKEIDSQICTIRNSNLNLYDDISTKIENGSNIAIEARAR